jgi:hypothetical protein
MAASGVNEYRFCGAAKAASRIDTRRYKIAVKQAALQWRSCADGVQRLLPKPTLTEQPLAVWVGNMPEMAFCVG